MVNLWNVVMQLDFVQKLAKRRLLLVKFSDCVPDAASLQAAREEAKKIAEMLAASRVLLDKDSSEADMVKHAAPKQRRA